MLSLSVCRIMGLSASELQLALKVKTTAAEEREERTFPNPDPSEGIQQRRFTYVWHPND